MSTEIPGNRANTRRGFLWAPRSPAAIGLLASLNAALLVALSTAFIASVLVCVSPAGATDSATIALADLDGRWRQIDSEVATKNRIAAIDTAVEPLSWVVQKMASGVLRSSTAPRSTLDFVWDGKRLHERVPGKNDIIEARPIDPGSTRFKAVDSRGEPFEGAWDWTTDGLRFQWRQHQAHGVNLYRMDDGKRTLTVEHTIQITALDGVKPIRYQSRFAKVALAAVSASGAPDEP